MGMHDYIVCRYPLPTVPPPWATPDYQYQSKSLDCRMAVYEIGEDGKLRQSQGGMFEEEFDSAPIPFDGVIEFYHSNWTAMAYGMVFTPDGSAHESVTYEATFIHGTVSSIVETERTREPSLSREVYSQLDGMFEEDKPVIDESEPEIGAEMYVMWGSIDRKLKGYVAKLIAKTSRDWAFTVGEKIETIDPHQLGSCLFHSETDAKAQRSWEHRLWDRKTEYCKELLVTTQRTGPPRPFNDDGKIVS